MYSLLSDFKYVYIHTPGKLTENYFFKCNYAVWLRKNEPLSTCLWLNIGMSRKTASISWQYVDYYGLSVLFSLWMSEQGDTFGTACPHSESCLSFFCSVFTTNEEWFYWFLWKLYFWYMKIRKAYRVTFQCLTHQFLIHRNFFRMENVISCLWVLGIIWGSLALIHLTFLTRHIHSSGEFFSITHWTLSS